MIRYFQNKILWNLVSRQIVSFNSILLDKFVQGSTFKIYV